MVAVTNQMIDAAKRNDVDELTTILKDETGKSPINMDSLLAKLADKPEKIQVMTESKRTRRKPLNEELDVSQAVSFDMSSLENFIISFERLTNDRIEEIVEGYPENIKKLIVSILMVDPGGYDINREPKIVPKKDAEILRSVKAIKGLEEAFENLYNVLLTIRNQKAMQDKNIEPEQEAPKEQEVAIEPNVEEGENVVEGINISKCENVVLTEKKYDDGRVFSFVLNDIDSYKTEMDIEEVIVEQLGTDARINCTIYYETINNEKIHPNSSDINIFLEENLLSGNIDVFIPETNEEKEYDDGLLDDSALINEIQKRIVNESIVKPDIKNLLETVCEEYELVFTDEKIKTIVEATEKSLKTKPTVIKEAKQSLTEKLKEDLFLVNNTGLKVIYETVVGEETYTDSCFLKNELTFEILESFKKLNKRQQRNVLEEINNKIQG